MRLLWEKAFYILRTRGLIALMRSIPAFLLYAVFFHQKYHLRVINLNKSYDLDIPPMPDDHSFHVITSNSRGDELSGDGYIFDPWPPEYMYRLDRGALAFCIFVDRKLGHVSWCATTAEAAKALGEPPVRVNFSNKEFITGDYWTAPVYRGKGLATHGTYLRRRYLVNQGFNIERGAMAVDNVAVHRIPRGHSSQYATGRYIKIFWWRTWKEFPAVSQEAAVEKECPGK